MPARNLLLVILTAACSYARPADRGRQLVAIEPSIANTGDTITLEGTFDATAQVNFPGGVTRAATVLGPHRARVIVPAEATAGDLSVTTGGETVGPVAFRRVSFAMELQTFRPEYEQADIARQAPSLVIARSFAASVVVKSFLYVLGGIDIQTRTALNTVERATINADGSLGSFEIVDDRALASARGDHTSAVVGDWLYVLGGRAAGTPLRPELLLDSIERAHIRDDGMLERFEVVPDVALAVPRSGQSGVVIGNSLYVIGGTDLSIERATINPNGSLEPFAIVPEVHLPSADGSVPARIGHATAVVGDSLYVVGGENGTELRTVDRASIAPDGSLGPFASAGPAVALTVPRAQTTLVVLGKQLFIIGGLGLQDTRFKWLNSIERAPIDGSGTLASFESIPGTLVTARRGATSAVVGNYVYVLGGDNSNTSLNTVERAAINVGDSISAFGSPASDVKLGITRHRHTSAVLGNWLYELGGVTTGGNPVGLNDVERAPIAADGSLGPFSSTCPLSNPHADHASAVVQRSLYVLGGGLSRLVSERATISSGGVGCPFAPAPGTTLGAPRVHHTSALVGNTLYLLGGFLDPDSTDIVEQATVGPGGEPSSFAAAGRLTTPRFGHTSAVLGRYLYVFGGADSHGSSSGTVLNSIERALITDGTVGPFSIVSPSLAIPRYWHTSAVVGRYIYMIGGVDSNHAAMSSVERASIGLDGSVGGFEVVPGVELDSKRYGLTNAVVGSSLYVVGGSPTGPASQTVGTVQQATLQ